MSYPHPLGCQWCGGPYNDGNCPSCCMVESGNGSVYNQDPYSCHNTTDLFHQLPHCDTQQFYCCEYCGGSHSSSDCQSGNTLVYEQVPDNNYDYNTYHSQPHQLYCCEYCGDPHSSLDCQTGNPIPCNNYNSSYQDQSPQYQMIQATPHETTTDLLLKTLELLKELKEESAMSSQDNPNEKSMEVLLAEERAAKLDSQIAFEQSVKESIAKEKAARSSSRFRFIPDDDDDEDILDILQFYNSSSSSSDETPSMKSQGDKTMMELLAEEQMLSIRHMYASPSNLPQSVVITPDIPTHSLNMGDELLSTIPEMESSSVEDLIPIPRESQGISDHLCDIPFPLECSQDHFETFSDLSDDCASYGNIEYVEASIPQSDADPLLEEFSGELTHINPLFDFEADLGETESLLDNDRSLTSYPNSPIENVDHFVPETFKATFTNPLFEFDSEFTLISENPLFDTQTEDSDEPTMEQEFTNSHHVNDYLHEEFSGELTHIMTPLEYDCLDGKDHNRGEKISICIVMTNLPTLPTEMPSNPKSSAKKIQISATALNPEDEDLIMIVIMILLLFFTYGVTSSLLHSFGNEDIIFDPGIFINHF